MFKLTGKNVLITGATGGIGASIARTLAKQGANLVLSGTKEERLQKLAGELADVAKNEVKYVACNLADSAQVNDLFDKAEELADGQIDILICNAGITKDGLVLRMKDEDFDQVIDINLKSTFSLNRNAIKKMMRRKYGRIINISSIVAVGGNPGQSNYVASKAGMIGMSKSMALEVASRGITINCIAPGFIQTAMTDVLTENQKNAMISQIPMGKMGSVDDVAASISFLASEEAGYITGQTLHINGGMLMV